jgi:hypothetical protein
MVVDLLLLCLEDTQSLNIINPRRDILVDAPEVSSGQKRSFILLSPDLGPVPLSETESHGYHAGQLTN